MPITNCRTTERRKELVCAFEIHPACHVKLLAGQTKDGAAGPLTDRYYAFEYLNKSNERDAGTFLCGYHCAEDFLQLLGMPKLKLFNPLSSELAQAAGVKGNHSPREHGENDGHKATAMHSLNREIYNAINLLCMAWNTLPREGLATTLSYIREYPQRPRPDFVVDKLNYIVSKDKRGRTLRQMIAELEANGNILRHFAFSHIEEVLKRLGLQSHIDPITPPNQA